MISFKESKNIYLYSENIDMRMGINKIQIKMYYEDDYGCWLLQNRLFEGKFKWPKGLEIGTRISKEQLNGLCKGLEVIESKRIKEIREFDYF